MSAIVKSITEIDVYVAKRLLAARKGSGLSQSDAAHAVGLSFQQVQKYELGKNRISSGKLAVLARLYSKPIAWFFPDAGKPIDAQDAATELLTAWRGADLARAYIALPSNAARQVVAIVTEALAKNRAAHG